MITEKNAETLGKALSIFLSALVYPTIQKEDFEKWKLNGRDSYNWWRSIGWGILGTVAFFTLAGIVVLVLYSQGLVQ